MITLKKIERALKKAGIKTNKYINRWEWLKLRESKENFREDFLFNLVKELVFEHVQNWDFANDYAEECFEYGFSDTWFKDFEWKVKDAYRMWTDKELR